ncbi:hypothetical protein [Psychroserpens sp. NJDZ02]|uniref:hypothetical protein n=1 Tax=Psychroserpens sp. NJDZ02 TaxID=2570561 RepID=UPI0010A777D4|nr:hypothetical protein [Psychroserpens sp. NJDZ02]QCE40028.1 hypothetical protein E9099_00855 [Psychroserpens sp. NJDZ02]
MTKTVYKYLLTALLLISVLSCKDKNKSILEQEAIQDSLRLNAIETFKKDLIPSPLEHTDFYISLPKDYIIKPQQGPDFNIFYVVHNDTISTTNYYGGLYIGNHPNTFEMTNDSCNIDYIEGNVFDKKNQWTTYNCNEDYSLEAVIDNKYNQSWNQKIHFFGNSVNKEGIDKLIMIYETLSKR